MNSGGGNQPFRILYWCAEYTVAGAAQLNLAVGKDMGSGENKFKGISSKIEQRNSTSR